MPKRFFAVLTALALLCACLPLSAVSVSAETTSGTTGDCTWTLTGTHLTISGNGAMEDYTVGVSTSPWGRNITSVTIEDGVTAIGRNAFADHYSLTSVTISDSVTTIGSSAFSPCTALTSIKVDKNNPNYCSVDGALFSKDQTTLVQYPGGKSGTYTIPDSVTTIGEYAFFGCNALTSVTIPDSVTAIGVRAFYHCDSLTSATIPDSVTIIGYGAFYYCDALASVTIPDSVTTIGQEAFSYCESLTAVTIPDSVTTIGEEAFAGCFSLKAINVAENNPNYCDVDGVLFNKKKTSLIQCPGGKSGAYTTPDSVVTIEEGAFAGCFHLNMVSILDNVTTIGVYAFLECYSLTAVTIGDSVTTIEEGAFAGCDALTDVYYSGTVADRQVILIEAGNEDLCNANWHYMEQRLEEKQEENPNDFNWWMIIIVVLLVVIVVLLVLQLKKKKSAE